MKTRPTNTKVRALSIPSWPVHRKFRMLRPGIPLSYSITKLLILGQVTSISNPPEAQQESQKKCHSTIAIDRTLRIALP